MASSMLAFAFRHSLLWPRTVASQSVRRPAYPISPFWNHLPGPSLPQFWQYRNQHTMGSSRTRRSEPFLVNSTIRGDSGRIYKVEEILSERRKPLLCVYRASSEGKQFILKDMIKGEFDYQLSLQTPLAPCPHIRVLVDTIRDDEMFVYGFLPGDLLHLSQQALSKQTRRHILKSALLGLAELHDRGIIHTDIKPNNILLDYDTTGPDIRITQVRISDLEDSVLLGPGKSIKGCLCGNELWRSPESWARAKQNTPSDIYSFAIMAIYVMSNEMVFRVSDEELKSDMAWWHILRRHISYFADEAGFQGLLGHIGEDNPFFERLIALTGDFNADKPRQPFALWHGVEPDFRDLVGKMANLDPNRRITAREALEHPWFKKAVL
ncbi:kinase-like domain-containing protein [Thermothelomyces heterothallicus CBS 202.75]|uniref:kinase-like domain-containing protein n=1 Tax=Thermothelomyces heterothallicus CBS 202.75 TaxID=1149848 RepID=UPI003741F1D7